MKVPLNRRTDMKLFSILEYLLAAFADVVARVEALRARMSEAGRQATCRACRDMEELFESPLSEAFA
jgi:hypothetical protein